MQARNQQLCNTLMDLNKQISQVEGISMLGIGSEMNSLASTLPVEAIPPLEVDGPRSAAW